MNEIDILKDKIDRLEVEHVHLEGEVATLKQEVEKMRESILDISKILVNQELVNRILAY